MFDNLFLIVGPLATTVSLTAVLVFVGSWALGGELRRRSKLSLEG
jgi:hypothetical protein